MLIGRSWPYVRSPHVLCISGKSSHQPPSADCYPHPIEIVLVRRYLAVGEKHASSNKRKGEGWRILLPSALGPSISKCPVSPESGFCYPRTELRTAFLNIANSLVTEGELAPGVRA